MLKVIKPYGANSAESVVQIPDFSVPKPVAQEAETVEQTERQHILRRAEEEALFIRQNIIRQAEEQAEKVRSEILEQASAQWQKLLEQAQTEAQELRERAYREGREEGKRQMEAEITRCLEDFVHTGEELEERQKRFFEQYQLQVKDFALEIAEKILHKQITLDAGEMLSLVQAAVSSVREAEWITIRVSKEVDGLAETLRTSISPATVVGAKRIDIVESDVPPDTCVVETPTGTIDASVSTQVQNLKELFREV